MSSDKGVILDERGNTYTNQWENDNNQLINELLKTMEVEIRK
ncbi:hypothetical protein [Peptoniphilus harei]|nr:hypothetical protein [Peptoniphilus harei]